MSSFIKIVEIWEPAVGKRGLVLTDGLYGDYDEFREISAQRVFRYGEGLPGQAWLTASAQIVTDLEHSYFERKEAAARAKLSVGVGIPIFIGEFLKAVVVLLCGHVENETGAIELWETGAECAEGTAGTAGTENPDELSLAIGYYNSLKKLKLASQTLRFSKGIGLPGTVWDYRIPIVADMSDSSLFRRASTAAIEGITSAIGLPFMNYAGKEYVLTFLSSSSTPIARRFEIWLPDRDHEHLTLHAHKCEMEQVDLPQDKERKIHLGEGLIGQSWITGTPAISTDLVGDGLLQIDLQPDVSTGLVLPIIEEGFLKSIVVLMF